jgi:hypothetical protein
MHAGAGQVAKVAQHVAEAVVPGAYANLHGRHM